MIVIAAILVLAGGVFAFEGTLQISGLALFAALAASVAWVAGGPVRGPRWAVPAVIGVAMATVILAGFLPN
ncbi:MAG TPA: hypothetical protein VHZ98_00790 [Galbitalea sp.]|jgi:hypothetical protein|nr:hypothetical protein [Galbitalea sp.]